MCALLLMYCFVELLSESGSCKKDSLDSPFGK